MHLRSSLPFLLLAGLAPGAARADDCPAPYETDCYADQTCDQYCEPEVATAPYSQPVLAPVPRTMAGYLATANTGPYDATIDPVKFSGLRGTFASQSQRDRSAYLQDGMGNQPWALRHLPWYTNGNRVASCDEYIYERWFDYSEFEDAVTLHGTDYRTIFELTAADLAGGVASRTLPFLPIAPAPVPVYQAPKNAYFLLDPVYPAGTEAWQHPFSATAQELFTHLADGREAYAHTVAWHQAISDELASDGYTDDVLYALAQKQREFAVLVAQRDAVVQRWRNFEQAMSASVAVCELPPDTLVQDFPWPEILDLYDRRRWGLDLGRYYARDVFDAVAIDTPPALVSVVSAPAVYDSPLLQLMLAAQEASGQGLSLGDIVDDEITDVSLPGTCTNYTGPDGLPNRSWLAPCDDVARWCEPDIRQAVAERLAALDAEIDAALQAVAPYGCLEYEEGASPQLGQPAHLFASPCDWNPEMYVREMTNQFAAPREAEYRECVRIVGPEFGHASHPIHHPSWLDPTRDYSSSSEDVLAYIEGTKAAAAQIAYGTDRDGNAIPGHSAADSSEMGSDMFGVDYSYDAGWNLTGLPTAGDVCQAGIHAYANADVTAKALKASRKLLALDASIDNEPATGTTRQVRRALSVQVLEQFMLVDESGTDALSPALTFHVAEETGSDTEVADQRIPVVGFFVHIRAGVAGRVGLNFDATVDAGACGGKLTGTIEPWTSLDVYVSGGLDILAVEIGLRVDLTLLKLSLPLTLQFALVSRDGEAWIEAAPNLSMKLTALSGRFRAYVDFPVVDPIYVTLFAWDGIELASHTLFAPTWRYALTLVNVGLGGGQ